MVKQVLEAADYMAQGYDRLALQADVTGLFMTDRWCRMVMAWHRIITDQQRKLMSS